MVRLNENMNKFAKLWPNELSTVEAERDLGYKPTVSPSFVLR